MRKVVVAILLFCCANLSAPETFAAVKAGDSCSKAGVTSISNGKKFTCIKSGKKLMWNNGVAIKVDGKTNTPTQTEATRLAEEKAQAEKLAAEKIAAEQQAAKLAADQQAAKLAAELAQAQKLAAEKIQAYRSTLLPCPADGKCKVGNIGPGGGIVFYVAPSPQSWGQYLEAAPSNWSGSIFDPYTQWCALGDTLLASHINNAEGVKNNSSAIGSGKVNSELMFSSCMKGIANLVKEYKGGGKSDWYIPSTNEMTELLNKSAIVGDLSVTSYWSSTLAPVYGGWDQLVPIGTNYTSDETNASSVRPIRAFP